MSAAAAVQDAFGHIYDRAKGPLARKLVSAAGWSIAAAAVARAAMLISWVFCGRMLTHEEFGSVALIYSTVMLMANVGGLGLGVTASRFVGELRHTDCAKAGRIIAMSSVLSLGSGLLLAGILFSFAGPIAARVLGRENLRASLQVGSIAVLFSALNVHQLGTLSGLHAFRRIAHLSVYTGIFSVVAMLVGLRSGRAIGAIWALALWRVVTWVAHWLVLRQESRSHGILVDFRHWGDERSILWRFSIPALLTSLIVSPATWLCTLMLARSPQGYSQVAVYSAADRLHIALLFVPAAMFSTAMPLLSSMRGQGNAGGFRTVFRANAFAGLTLAGLPALIFIVAAPQLMGFFGKGYVGGAPVLRLLCVAAIGEVINGVIGQTIALRSMWIRLSFDMLLTVTLLSGCYLAIPRWKSSGFAAAYAAAFAVTSVALCVYAVRTRCASGEYSAVSPNS